MLPYRSRAGRCFRAAPADLARSLWRPYWPMNPPTPPAEADTGERPFASPSVRRLAREEGILAGPSSGGALAVALKLSEQLENAVIVSIVCDRGDRYLSTGLFPD